MLRFALAHLKDSKPILFVKSWDLVNEVGQKKSWDFKKRYKWTADPNEAKIFTTQEIGIEKWPEVACLVFSGPLKDCLT